MKTSILPSTAFAMSYGPGSHAATIPSFIQTEVDLEGRIRVRCLQIAPVYEVPLTPTDIAARHRTSPRRSNGELEA